MYSDMRWRVYIKNLEAHIGVGIHEHEKIPQRVIINATIESMYSTKPSSIKQCFNYDHVHKLVIVEWPKRPHVFLLETCVVELLEHIFRVDDRVIYAKVSVCKPDIFPEAEFVGVEAEWTRENFVQLIAKEIK